MYALIGLAGLPHGEIAGLHWRNYDPTREPLGKLVIARRDDNATTKSKRRAEVPVHPILAKQLEAWRGKGCAEILKRAPEPDDLLVPSRQGETRSRHHTRNSSSRTSSVWAAWLRWTTFLRPSRRCSKQERPRRALNRVRGWRGRR
jgi:integrase